MKSNALVLIVILFTAGWTSVGSQIRSQNKAGINILTRKEIKEGWQLLFDGKSWNGWRGINKSSFPSSGWKIENGIIHKTRERSGDIITIKKYSDFVLDWEWKLITSGGNSGLKYFVNERAGDTGGYGYGLEYQILDDPDWLKDGRMQPNDYHTLGALYEIYPPDSNKKSNPLGQWNKSRIISRGQDVEHWLNGEMILKYTRGSDDFKNRIGKSKFKDVNGYGLFPDGHILLQDHDSEAFFRNIKIRELK